MKSLTQCINREGSENLSFIGGTAIRIVYGSQRFSEDLDFDNFGLTFEQFENLLKKQFMIWSIRVFSLEFRFVEKKVPIIVM
jgi:predicted nucleotidyltransferase component of viral defense system